jgi:hypothetical protein
MSPKENHTREIISKETTTEQIRLLLSGTPLSEITTNGLQVLINRHGIERLLLAADIAAETWRRERKEIRNPGGYLQSLCDSYVEPSWYVPLEERKARLAEAEEQKRSATKAEEARKAAEAREARAREEHWMCVSEDDRERFRSAAVASLPPWLDLPSFAIEEICKTRAWESRTLMNTKD